MERRAFIQAGVTGLASSAGWSVPGSGMAAASQAARGSENQDPLQDGYHAPDWLRYARAIYFEGYAPPVFPHVVSTQDES